MAKLLKMRFLDPSQGDNGVYTEIYCDQDYYRGYFRRYIKSELESKETTIRVKKDDLFELRTLGNGWKSVNKTAFEKYLKQINVERIANGWQPITLPEQQ